MIILNNSRAYRFYFEKTLVFFEFESRIFNRKNEILHKSPNLG